jgi:hypothetical protein
MDIGYQDPKDPVLKAFQMIQEINAAAGQLGVW